MMLDLILLLAATLLLVPLTKRYAITPVLGYLLAGLLLGSGVFNLVHDQKLIAQLTDLGMILLMFFFGFAFAPKQFWQQRREIRDASGLPLVLILLGLWLSAWLIFQEIGSGFIMAIALALSSVCLVQQLLQYQRFPNHALQQSSFLSLQLHSLVAVVVLALLPLLTDATSTQHGIAYFAVLIAAISALLLSLRYLIRPIFHFLAKYQSIELLAVFSLLVLLSSILLVDILNIHILVGAFLAGVVLAQSEFKTEIQRILQPIQQPTMGLFFLAIGLTLSFQPLRQQPLNILLMVLAILLIKLAVIAAISFYQQRNQSLSVLLGTTLAQSGELGLILLIVATQEQLLAQPLFDTALWIVTFSMFLTPLLYWLVNAKVIPKLQKRLAHDQEDVAQHPIIIVGFGRFGQVVARVLHAQGQQFTVIDSNQPDAGFIEQYGHRFIDADVTQSQNLRAAGIEYCKLLILAIDDVEDSMNIARHLHLNYPDLNVLVRARDRHHVHLLQQLGIQHIWRESYFSALQLAQQALLETGYSKAYVQHQMKTFQREDEQYLAQHYGDEMTTTVMAELEYLFAHCTRHSENGVNNVQRPTDQADSPSP